MVRSQWSQMTNDEAQDKNKVRDERETVDANKMLCRDPEGSDRRWRLEVHRRGLQRYQTEATAASKNKTTTIQKEVQVKLS